MESSIFLNDLEFFGAHGIYPAEQGNKQRFLVSVELFGDFLQAAQTDDIGYTSDYSAVYNLIKNIAEEQHFGLIEALAHKIGSEILKKFKPVRAITVVVKKFPSSWEDKNYGSIGFRTTITR